MILIFIFITLTFGQVAYQPQGILQPIQTSRVQYACQNGFTWNGQICVPCATLQNGYYNCSTMYNCSGKACNLGYMLFNQKCIQIPAGCLQSTNIISFGPSPSTQSLLCFACSNGYTLIGNICVPNNNCMKWNVNNAQCIECDQGYYFNWDLQQTITTQTNPYYLSFNSFCTQCSTNCLSCSSGTTCNTCNSGYYWQIATTTTTGNCSACMTSCISCTSATTCSQCASGHYLTTIPSCQSCGGNTSTTGTPPFGVANCATCSLTSGNNIVTCQSCNTGYQLSGSACVQCPTSCITCSSANICKSCIQNYLLDTQSNLCVQCPIGCQQQQCQFLNGSSGLLTCSACQDTYYRDLAAGTTNQYICNLCSNQNSVWFRCSGPYDNSNNSNNSKLIPTQCNAEYFLINQKCIVSNNPNYCALLTETNTNLCQQCLTGNQLTSGQCYTCPSTCPNSCTYSNSVAKCSSCPLTGYYYQNQQCLTCPNGCSECNGNSCISCYNGYYYSNNSCTLCSTSCQQCESTNQCAICKDGYYLQNGYCYSCQYQCASCNGYGNLCTSCNNGYILQNDGCVSLEQANCYLSNTTNGCEICQYGYDMVIAKQGNITINTCIQCISPYSSFVCRQNYGIPGTSIPYQGQSTNGNNIINNLNQGVQTKQMNPSTQYSCINGYYWTGQSCMPCKQINNGVCTCSSINNCTTLICNQNYILLNNNCVQLPQGCVDYELNQEQTTYICNQCSSSYTLINNICIQNGSNCIKINNDNGFCQQCADGYYFNWNYNYIVKYTSINNYFLYFPQFCTICQPNCTICSSQNTCDQCSQGYYWQQSTYTSTTSSTTQQYGKCTPCNIGCLSCQSATTCKSCQTGYFTTTYPSSNEYSTICTACPINCIECTQISSCITCQAGYILQNQMCTKLECETPCATCSASNVCATCVSGYILSTYNNTPTCIACPLGCVSCSLVQYVQNETTCTGGCQDQYFPVATSTTSEIVCNLCASVNKAWIRCISQTIPTQCINGYYLYTGIVNGNTLTLCVNAPTTPTCLTIASNISTNCATCLPNYQQIGQQCVNCQIQYNNCSLCTVQNSALQCMECNKGYYLNSNNLCIQCSTGCMSCTIKGCAECGLGNYLSQVSSNNQQICIGCPYGCGVCENEWNCNSCMDGYYIQQYKDYNVCYACQSECVTCEYPGSNCLSCQNGYILQNGGCISLNQANCNIINQNGCSICNYGFALIDSIYCIETIASQANYIYTPYVEQPTPTPSNPIINPTPQPIIANALLISILFDLYVFLY